MQQAELNQRLKEAFQEYQNKARQRLMVELRRWRAPQIRKLLERPQDLNLEIFNHEVWQAENYSIINGEKTKLMPIVESIDDKEKYKEYRRKIRRALEKGELEIHGNFCWGSGSGTYGSMFKISNHEKEQNIKKAAAILNGHDLTPLKKAREVMEVPGFGRNSATGMVMLFHPTEFAIYNKPSSGALQYLGRETETLEAFQKEVTRLKELVGAEDFLELDWFLYLVTKGAFSQLPSSKLHTQEQKPVAPTADLHSAIEQDILTRRERLVDSGDLLPRDQVKHLLLAFQERFGPEVLRELSGRELLDRLHGGRELGGLNYWLEFKNDDEFPGLKFGGIAGGSAHKWGVFRRKEDGLWYTGSPQKQYQITEDEAISMAREQRDQLLAADRLLRDLPLDAGRPTYQELQENLQEAMPDLAHLGWVHKYLCLLHQDKLDDFHNQRYQRFHLIKLLRQPPETEGLYVAGGDFTGLARKLGMPVIHLTGSLNDRNGSPHSYWRIGTTSGDTGEDHFGEMLKGSHVSVGFERTGDFFELGLDTWQKMRDQLAEDYPDMSPSVLTYQAKQMHRFASVMAEDDLVLACDGAKVRGIGRVTGSFRYQEGLGFPHLRPVEWLNTTEWKMPAPEGLRTTFYEIKKPVNLIEVERRLLAEEPVTPIIGPTSSLQGVPARIESILERKGQVILFGPPGTGKTFWALKAARELAARSHFGRSLVSLSTAEQRILVGEDGTPGVVQLCTFHPSYGYEDFIEGYRPQAGNQGMTFVLRDGIFLELCQRAAQEPKKRFFMVVDEINRGDIPRIFGELITLLEKDKRGQKLVLPLSGRHFAVPPNLFIIGTMNTADRSIALLDTALRRRFGFVELMPDYSLLDGAVLEGVPLAAWLRSLNQKIVTHVGTDARNLQIGHAYLMTKEGPLREFSEFIRVVREDIVPLLQEYCYEDYTALQAILGNDLVDAAAQKVRDEKFFRSTRAEMVQALLALDPDITGTAEAGRADEVEETDEEDLESTDTSEVKPEE